VCEAAHFSGVGHGRGDGPHRGARPRANPGQRGVRRGSSFVTSVADEFARRHVPFDRWFNMRDVGGYHAGDGQAVRWERLYRAAAPMRLTAYDLERVRVLGLRTQIDLRGADEAASSSPLSELGIEYHPAPVATLEMLPELDRRTGAGISADRYLAYLDLGAAGIRRTFELLAEPRTYPATVHCGLGNHRTGVLIALILEVLGVPRATIMLDYGFTNPELDRLAALWRERGWIDPGQATIDPLFRVRPEVIGEFLAMVDERHGGVEAYLRSIGVPPSAITSLRAELLEARR
jgi:protein-tyrosine phosphatase